MIDSDILEIISMISYNDIPISQMNRYIEDMVDIFFKDSELTELSSFFTRLKQDMKTLNLPIEKERSMIREIIGYITEQYEKKYGEEVCLRIFMHLNLL
jgi:hypothetical protein